MVTIIVFNKLSKTSRQFKVYVCVMKQLLIKAEITFKVIFGFRDSKKTREPSIMYRVKTNKYMLTYLDKYIAL